MDEIPGIDSNQLITWIQDSIQNNKNILSSGYQGKIFFYREGECRLVIKVASRLAYLKSPFLWMLKHEYQIYQMLRGVSGIPRCYGFLNKQYLVLEFIDGETLRQAEHQAESVDRMHYYSALLELIQALHARGVAHTDLKRKDNILVSLDKRPFIIDFGAAVARKKGFSPLNHYLFSMGKRFDLNAWVKHKYSRAYGAVSDADQQYLSRTHLERISRVVKRGYKQIKQLFVKV